MRSFLLLCLVPFTSSFLLPPSLIPRSALSADVSFTDALRNLNVANKQQDVDKFAIENEIGTSTSAWTSAGFTTSPITKKVSPTEIPSFGPGDLQGITATLGFLSPFISTSESSSYCEEMLGLFPSTPPLLATTYTPKPLFLRRDCTQKLSPSTTPSPNPPPLRALASSPLTALQSSLTRLSAAYLHLYLLDLTPSKSGVLYLGGLKSAVKGMAMCKTRGLAEHVGVKNPKSGKIVRRMYKLFEKCGVKMEAVEVDFSLVDRTAMNMGVLKVCEELGVKVLATTPMGVGGIGSGAYTAVNPTGGAMGPPKFKFADLDKLMVVHQALRSVSEMVRGRLKDAFDEGNKDGKATFKGDVTTSAVAVNYVRAKGCVALPSCVSATEAGAVMGVTEWKLRGDEMEILEKAAAAYESMS